MALIVLSILTLVYIIGTRPFTDKKLNASELFNNFFLYVVSLFMLFFTAPDAYFLLGYQLKAASLTLQLMMVVFTYANLTNLIFSQVFSLAHSLDDYLLKSCPCYKKVRGLLSSRLVSFNPKVSETAKVLTLDELNDRREKRMDRLRL